MMALTWRHRRSRSAAGSCSTLHGSEWFSKPLRHCPLLHSRGSETAALSEPRASASGAFSPALELLEKADLPFDLTIPKLLVRSDTYGVVELRIRGNFA